jgi:hypothetical protein
MQLFQIEGAESHLNKIKPKAAIEQKKLFGK